MPELFAVVRAADEQLRLFLIGRLTTLVAVLRQHLRRWLPDLVGLVHDFWGAGVAVLTDLLRLVSELASALPIILTFDHQDMSPYPLAGFCMHWNMIT